MSSFIKCICTFVLHASYATSAQNKRKHCATTQSEKARGRIPMLIIGLYVLAIANICVRAKVQKRLTFVPLCTVFWCCACPLILPVAWHCFLELSSALAMARKQVGRVSQPTQVVPTGGTGLWNSRYIFRKCVLVYALSLYYLPYLFVSGILAHVACECATKPWTCLSIHLNLSSL